MDESRLEEFELIDDIELESGKAPLADERSEEQKSGKRRRRRRRGGRRSRRESDATASEAAEAEVADEGSADLEFGDETTSEAAPRLEPEGSQEGRPDDRPARRRRRRGGRRGGSHNAEAEKSDAPRERPSETEEFLGSDDAFETREFAAESPEHEVDRRSRDDAEDADDDEPNGDELPEGKAASRDIPTWKEVIGLIIAGNMESRARSPKSGGGPYRGRGSGGRGHGRGHDSGNRQ
ncbi:MAG TPA: hypothetical protein VGY55_17450 [Pirellulales bacterium]|nr:hypothetical protein [Pirellulales bacterium]